MSTRAVYTFTNYDYSDNPISIYIHQDGYPKGAAVYFWKAVNRLMDNSLKEHFSRESTQFPVAFLRANERAEITDGPEYHGDLEYTYSYNVKANKLVVAQLIPFEDTAEKIIFSGTLEDFINANPDGIDSWGGDWASYEFLANIDGTFYTKDYIESLISIKEDELSDYQEKFPTHTGNIQGLERAVERLDGIMVEYDRLFDRSQVGE